MRLIQLTARKARVPRELVTIHRDDSRVRLVTRPSVVSQADDSVNSDTNATQPDESFENVCAALHKEHEPVHRHFMESIENVRPHWLQDLHDEATNAMWSIRSGEGSLYTVRQRWNSKELIA